MKPPSKQFNEVTQTGSIDRPLCVIPFLKLHPVRDGEGDRAIRGEFLAAIGHYQEAEQWDSAIPGLYRNLGVAAFRVQNYPEAIRALSKAVTVSQSDAPARAMLGSLF